MYRNSWLTISDGRGSVDGRILGSSCGMRVSRNWVR
jgi:hypothetical protein